MNEEEEDSFQAYKNQLQDGLGYNEIKKPMKPMNPYMRFFLEKSSQKKLQSPGLNNQLISKAISQEWRMLDESKKQYYNKLYQISRNSYRSLVAQYEQVTGKKKYSSLYSSYISKRYAQYSKQYPNKASKELMKMANQDWRNIDEIKKKQMKVQWEDENQQLPQEDQKEKINEYNQKLKQYTQKIEEEKLKIIKKYRLTQQNRKKIEKKSKKIGEKDAIIKVLKQQQKSQKNMEKQFIQQQFEQGITKSKRAREEIYSIKKKQIQEIRRQLRSLGIQQCKRQMILPVPAELKNEQREHLKQQSDQKEQQQSIKQQVIQQIKQNPKKNRRLSIRRKTAQKQFDKEKDYII